MARCELDGVLMYKGEELLLSIKALNEFDPKVTGARAGPDIGFMYKLTRDQGQTRAGNHCSPSRH